MANQSLKSIIFFHSLWKEILHTPYLINAKSKTYKDITKLNKIKKNFIQKIGQRTNEKITKEYIQLSYMYGIIFYYQC